MIGITTDITPIITADIILTTATTADIMEVMAATGMDIGITMAAVVKQFPPDGIRKKPNGRTKKLL